MTKLDNATQRVRASCTRPSASWPAQAPAPFHEESESAAWCSAACPTSFLLAEFPVTELDNATQRMRGFLYQAIGQLASRAPAPFHEDPEIAARLIAALSAEPAGVRAALQEALSTLATAYKGCPGVHIAGRLKGIEIAAHLISSLSAEPAGMLLLSRRPCPPWPLPTWTVQVRSMAASTCPDSRAGLSGPCVCPCSR